MKSSVKDFGLCHLDLSYEDTSTLKLLVSSALARLHYSKSHDLPYSKAYYKLLLNLHDRLDSFLVSFTDDLPF